MVEDGTLTDLMDKFVDYMQYGKWTPAGEQFDIGRACAKAVRNYAINDTIPIMYGDPSEYACGNGAVMRLAPLAISLVEEDNFRMRYEIYRDYTSITHRHPRAILGTVIYMELLHYLLKGEQMDEFVLKHVQESCFSANSIQPELKTERQYYQRLLNPNFKNINREDIKSTGYVIDTLEAAIWCALNQDTFEDAVILAVNLGGDTDTITSITATIKMCETLNLTLPENWVNALVNRRLLDSVVDPFSVKYDM